MILPDGFHLNLQRSLISAVGDVTAEPGHLAKMAALVTRLP